MSDAGDVRLWVGGYEGSRIFPASASGGNVGHPCCIKSSQMPKPALDQRSDDAALLERTAARETGAFERLMRRHNSRLFRVARAILKEDAAAEDAVQEAYLEAFRHAGTFRGDAQVSTWLTRIVINQSLMRLRRQKRDRVVVPFEGEGADGHPRRRGTR